MTYRPAWPAVSVLNIICNMFSFCVFTDEWKWLTHSPVESPLSPSSSFPWLCRICTCVGLVSLATHHSLFPLFGKYSLNHSWSLWSTMMIKANTGSTNYFKVVKCLIKSIWMEPPAGWSYVWSKVYVLFPLCSNKTSISTPNTQNTKKKHWRSSKQTNPIKSEIRSKLLLQASNLAKNGATPAPLQESIISVENNHKTEPLFFKQVK